MSLRRFRALAVCVSLAGCFEAPTVHEDVVSLRLPESTACRPTTAVRLTATALGDFAASNAYVDSWSSTRETRPLNAFPTSTAFIAFQADSDGWNAGGVARLAPVDGPSSRVEVLLLPFGRTCALADPEAGAPEGAAVLPLDDGYLVAGGVDARGQATRRVRRFREGQRVVDAIADLGLRRVDAVVTSVEGRWVVVGGAQQRGELGHDTFEVWDGLDGTWTIGSLAAGARTRAAAVPLDASSVLVVGGVAQDGQAPFDTMERIDLRAQTSRPTLGRLDVGLVAPSLQVLDDGQIVLAGGTSFSGRTERRVWVFDRVREAFDDTGVVLPERDAGFALALTGARLAWLGPRSRDVTLVHLGGAARSMTELPDVLPASVEGAVAAAEAPDGTLVVHAQSSAGPRAFVVDLNAPRVEERATSRTARHVVVFGGGVVAELGSEGASLRREAMRTPMHQPPALLGAGDARGLALDASERWAYVDGALTVVDPLARFDVPTLRFADMRLEIDAVGAGVDVLLTNDHASPLRFASRGDRFGTAFCDVARVDGYPVSVERRGHEAWLEAGGGRVRCDLSGFVSERVGVAVEAPRGSKIRAVRLERLDRRDPSLSI